MRKFNFEPCSTDMGAVIQGLYIVTPSVFEDDRGYFMETFNDEFAPYVQHLDGSQACFVQDNESMSRKGVLRGLHTQVREPQMKLVRVINGEVYDVAVDIRRNSPTFGCWHGEVLSAENRRQFLIPEGFLHGFMVLSEKATFVYKCTRYYNPGDEFGVMWDDPDIGIAWPNVRGNVILSPKDLANRSLRDIPTLMAGNIDRR